jgi:hypothetical protein
MELMRSNKGSTLDERKVSEESLTDEVRVCVLVSVSTILT